MPAQLVAALARRGRSFKRLDRFAIAIAVSALSVVMRKGVGHVLGANLPYVFALPSVLLVAVFAGFAPATVAVLITVAGVHWWAVGPAESPSLGALLIYTIVATACAWVASSYRDLLAESDARRDELARRDAQSAGEIAALKAAEEARRELQSELAAFFHSPAVGAAILSLDGRMLRVNEELCRMLGYSESELLQRACPDVTLSDDRPVLEASFDALLSGKRSAVVQEKRCIRKDGTQLWVQLSLSATRDVSGNPVQFVALLQDIDERKAADRSVNEKRRMESLLIELGEIGARAMPLGTFIETVGRRVATELGVSRCGFSRLDHERSVITVEHDYHSDLPSLASCYPLEEYAGHMRQACEEGRPFVCSDLKMDPRTADRYEQHMRSIQVRSHLSVPLIREGRWVGTFWVSHHEPREWTSAEIEWMKIIAERIWSLVERRQAERTVAESEARFRHLADAMPQLVWVARADGTVLYYNGRGKDYRGIDQQGDGSYSWRPVVHPDEVDDTAQRWAHSVATGEMYQAEHRLCMAEGDYRWHLSRAFPANRDGVVLWYGTATDIHAVKETQEALRLAKEESDAANRAKDEFLAALSHELRTPLTPALMAAAVLREDETLPPPVRRDLAMIHQNIALEARMIDDLLDLTRVARGKLPLFLQPCRIHSLLAHALEIVRDAAQQKRILIDLDLAATASEIDGDGTRLQQVFWNVLKNAVKFTAPGGEIVVRTRNEGAQLVVEIEDDGVGFAPDDSERIFVAFEQAGAPREHQFGGLGLGLSIARAVVELHGGRIVGRSAGVGRGAVFTISFSGARPPRAAERVQTDRAAFEMRPMRVLLVEDHEPTLDIITRLLTRAGHDVTTAASVAVALEKARAQALDVVISDLGLPDGTGLDLMPQLRALHAELRGIALSGYGMEADVRRSLEAGFAAHLVKPVDFDELRRMLRDL